MLVATYEHQDSGLRQLTAPAHDAESLASVLRDPDIAGFEVTTLINQPHHRVGEAIGEFYRDRRRDDLTLLYFTGHGLKDDSGRLYLAMTNTRRDSLLFTALSAEHVDQAMEGCPSRQKVLILDCCYSGAFPAGRLSKGDAAVHTLERFQGHGRTVLTASDATQYSFEGDRAHGRATQSVFTRYLVAGLRDGSADLDGDGDITLDELYGYVHDRVVDEMPQQRPKKLDNVEGRIVIARNVNWSLPAHLRNALGSPIATDRLSALDGLAHLRRIGNEQVRAVALEEIQRLAEDDSRVVSGAAATHLRPVAAPEAEPGAVAEAEPGPVAETPSPEAEPAPVKETQSPREAAMAPPDSPADPPTADAGPAPHPRRRTFRLVTASAATLALAAVVGGLLAYGGGDGGGGGGGGEDHAKSCPALLKPTATLPRKGNQWFEFSPDEKMFLTMDAGSENTLRLWDVETRTEQTTLEHQTIPNNGVAFSPGGQLLVTQSAAAPDEAVRVQLRTMASGDTLSIRTGDKGVVSAAVNPKGTVLATAGASHPKTAYNNWIQLWDTTLGESIGTFPGHTNGVEFMEFSRDGMTLATGGYDNKTKLWNMTDRAATVSVSGSAGGHLSPDGETFAAQSSDESEPMRLVDVATGDVDKSLTGTFSGIFSPDGTTLAAHTPSGGLRLWDVRKREFVADVGRDAAFLGFSPSGKVIAVWGPGDKVSLWDVKSHKTISTFAGTGIPGASRIGDDGKTFANINKDGSIAFWDISACS
nr:caspase family protein [Streptomyces sp. S3(2020)]